MKNNADENKFSSQTHRDVCKFRIESLLSYEATLKLDEPETWINFYNRVNDLKKQTIDFLMAAKKEGKRVYGYGASTKFNTTLQYFGINTSLVRGIAERNPEKFNLRTIGSNIPIIDEEWIRLNKPDYLLVGPAHFISEFKEREREYLERGGKFIVTMPKFLIITKDDL